MKILEEDMQQEADPDKDWEPLKHLKELEQHCIKRAHRYRQQIAEIEGRWSNAAQQRQQEWYLDKSYNNILHPVDDTDVVNKTRHFDRELVVGDEYEDRKGFIYEYIGKTKHPDRPMHPYVFVDRAGKLCFMMDIDISRHIPKKQMITGYLNIYKGAIREGYISGGLYETKEDAKRRSLDEIIACVPVTIEFTEGEGL